jgi:hypothetical protein
MSEFKHIHKSYRHLMTLSSEDRINALNEQVWIDYPKTVEIVNLLTNLMNRPKKPRMQNLLLIGESNIGKTSIIDRFATQNPNYQFEDNEGLTQPAKPVIVSQCPASADEKGLYISIIEQFWAPFLPSDTTHKLRHQAIYLIRQCHVKILILDEIHNLLAGTAAKQRMVMNVLKSLGNELQISLVGVGTKDASLILHSDPQHASRFDIYTLPKWELNKDFLSLLASFELRLPLKFPSNLKAREKATLLFSISGGNLGDLHRLLIECATTAILSGEEEISVNTIQGHKWVQKTKGIRSL